MNPVKRLSADLLLSIVFLTFLYAPLIAWLVSADKARSTTEQRALAVLPPAPDTLQAVRAYPRQFEQYYNDHFGFRERFLQYYDIIKYALGDPPSKHVVLGKDGWLFYNAKQDGDPIGDYRHLNVYTPEQLALAGRLLEERKDWLKQRGIEYLLVIPPNKETVYSEFMPEYLTKLNPQSAYDQLLSYVREHGTVRIVDLKAALAREKDPALPFYYKTDTHWNDYGANLAQYEIAKALAELFPGKLSPARFDAGDFVIEHHTHRDLAIMLGLGGVLSEESPVLRQELKINTCVRLLETEGDLALPESSFVAGCQDAELRGVIFRDSFFVHLQPYVSRYFQRATYVWKRFDPAEFENYLQKERPHVLIEEIVERFLPLP